MGDQRNGSVMRPTSGIKEGVPSIILAPRSMSGSAGLVQYGDKDVTVLRSKLVNWEPNGAERHHRKT